MSDNIIKVEIRGITKVLEALDKFPTEIDRMTISIGNEVYRLVIADQGGGKSFYPPETAANRPPTPYYIRGQGMQYATGNDGRSQQMDTKFYFNVNGLNIDIGNTATYAPYVVGDEQSSRMAAIGWRKPINVIRDNLSKITAIWQRGIDEIIKRLRL